MNYDWNCTSHHCLSRTYEISGWWIFVRLSVQIHIFFRNSTSQYVLVILSVWPQLFMFSALTSYNHAYADVGCKKWFWLIFLSDLFHEVHHLCSISFLCMWYMSHSTLLFCYLIIQIYRMQSDTLHYKISSSSWTSSPSPLNIPSVPCSDVPSVSDLFRSKRHSFVPVWSR